MKIDLKDRKILYQLSLNARQSLNQIGKKVNLSKNTVDYRIKKLEKNGIIRNYYTFIDGIRLGFTVIRLYISFQYITEEIKKEIIDYFINSKLAVVIYSLQGGYDFEVVFWFKDQNRFYTYWQKTLRKYGDYFQDQTISFYIKYITHKLSFLMSGFEKIDHAKNIDVLGGNKSIEVDDIDINILKIISSDARIPLINISKKIGMSPEAIKYRINNLIKNEIIKGFRANIDHSKIGYQYFKLDIYLKDYNQRDKIINYIKNNIYLFSIDVTTGSSHLELEFFVKDLSHLNEIMNEINKKFPGTMRNFKYLNFKEVHKYLFFPEE
jgi:Lrp/AsnC family transcriptional regulator for asnA, asnC and gidA